MKQHKISEIQIKLIKPQDGLVGFGSFVFDESLYLSSIGILTKLNGGYRLTYPTKKIGNNNLPIFHPINKEVGKLIERKVIKKVNELFNQNETQGY